MKINTEVIEFIYFIGKNEMTYEKTDPKTAEVKAKFSCL